MTRFCSNAACGRGFADCGRAKPPKGWTPPTLCPTCRAKVGREPLSRLIGGVLPGEAVAPAPPPSLEEQA
jgi:hypothetical protein